MAFAVGQYVELYPTIPSELGEYSIESGTRGIIQEVMGDGYAYRVRFLQNERLTEDEAWLDAIELFPA